MICYLNFDLCDTEVGCNFFWDTLYSCKKRVYKCIDIYLLHMEKMNILVSYSIFPMPNVNHEDNINNLSKWSK